MSLLGGRMAIRLRYTICLAPGGRACARAVRPLVAMRLRGVGRGLCVLPGAGGRGEARPAEAGRVVMAQPQTAREIWARGKEAHKWPRLLGGIMGPAGTRATRKQFGHTNIPVRGPGGNAGALVQGAGGVGGAKLLPGRTARACLPKTVALRPVGMRAMPAQESHGTAERGSWLGAAQVFSGRPRSRRALPFSTHPPNRKTNCT